MSDKLFNLAIDGVSYNIMAAGTLLVMSEKAKPHAYTAIGVVTVVCLIVAAIGIYRESRRSVLTGQDQSSDTLDDGHGNRWDKCGPGCTLHVVRPGKVQCEGECKEVKP